MTTRYLLKKIKLSDKDMEEIKAAVSRAESKTNGEIALALTAESDSYSFWELLSATYVAATVFIMLLPNNILHNCKVFHSDITTLANKPFCSYNKKRIMKRGCPMISHEPRCIYDKNPLAEVICQLRFPEILSIQTDIPAKFQDAIRKDFPKYMLRKEQLPNQCYK